MRTIFPICSRFFVLAFLIIILNSSCEKELIPDTLPVYTFETDSINDVDGNVYNTVKIGDQWWMAENLRVTRYRNQIPVYYNASMSPGEWSGLKKGAYCNLYFSSTPYNGHLYNWYAVNDTNILAPEGWRIPTDEDWTILEKTLGMNSEFSVMTGWRGTDQARKLKAVKGKENLWKIVESISNSNESGFTAYPGGCVLFNGSFVDSGTNTTGFWWCSSYHVNNNAWYRYLDYQYDGVFRYFAPKTSGYSIRCVKDAK